MIFELACQALRHEKQLKYRQHPFTKPTINGRMLPFSNLKGSLIHYKNLRSVHYAKTDIRR